MSDEIHDRMEELRSRHEKRKAHIAALEIEAAACNPFAERSLETLQDERNKDLLESMGLVSRRSHEAVVKSMIVEKNRKAPRH